MSERPSLSERLVLHCLFLPPKKNILILHGVAELEGLKLIPMSDDISERSEVWPR